MTRCLTIPEVMAVLGVKSKDTVYRLISAGELRTVDVSAYGRTRTRVREDDLQAFIDARTSEAPRRASA
ncbi:MAG: hypothetical protein JWO67_5157 [Streptosporangiaceae bacterium]|nr:hypothetical protein [Streptosporangiaceae bacterium]